jgi:acetyl esterase/lipase
MEPIEGFSPDLIEIYKRTPQGELKMHLFNPDAPAPRAGIVFFFGGGWNGGTPTQFYPQARHLADLGMFAACAEYRIRNTHHTPPSVCVRDGFSAMRWTYANAARFNIDPTRLAAGGGSAGGHVAAACAMCDGFDESDEDLSIPRRPTALVLFNPVYDNSPAGYGNDRVDVPWETFSPLHNITRHAPPTITLLGDRDNLIPVATAESFRDRMRAVGVRSDLHIYPGAVHGFFNFGREDKSAYRDTLEKATAFLRSLGYA